MKSSFSKSLEKTRRDFKNQDKRTTFVQIGKLIVIITAVVNLSYSQVHIEVITQIFNRLIGLVMFAFILFGLVSLFAVTRINDFKNEVNAKYTKPFWNIFVRKGVTVNHGTLSITRAVFSVLLTLAFAFTYVLMLLNDVNTQVAVTISTILPSFAFSIGIIVMYFTSIVFFILGERSREE